MTKDKNGLPDIAEINKLRAFLLSKGFKAQDLSSLLTNSPENLKRIELANVIRKSLSALGK